MKKTSWILALINGTKSSFWKIWWKTNTPIQKEKKANADDEIQTNPPEKGNTGCWGNINQYMFPNKKPCTSSIAVQDYINEQPTEPIEEIRYIAGRYLLQQFIFKR